jgi:hypothetical protein
LWYQCTLPDLYLLAPRARKCFQTENTSFYDDSPLPLDFFNTSKQILQILCLVLQLFAYAGSIL